MVLRRNSRLRTFVDIAIIISLFFGAYILFVLFFDAPGVPSRWSFHALDKPRSTYAEQEETKKESALEDAKIYNIAIESKDITLCERISDLLERSRCIDTVVASLALENKDREQCMSLSNTGMRDRCKDNITFQKAETEKNPEICSILIDENLRIQCREMIDTGNFDAALASGSLIDDSFCLTLSGSVRDKCRSRIISISDSELYQEALTSKSLADCEKISDPTMKARCRDTLLFDRALRDGELDMCSDLSEPDKIEYCRSSISAQKDVVLYQSVIRQGDIGQCADIQTETLREQCHDMVIIREVRVNQDIAPCDTLYNRNMVEGCKNIPRPQ